MQVIDPIPGEARASQRGLPPLTEQQPQFAAPVTECSGCCARYMVKDG